MASSPISVIRPVAMSMALLVWGSLSITAAKAWGECNFLRKVKKGDETTSAAFGVRWLDTALDAWIFGSGSIHTSKSGVQPPHSKIRAIQDALAAIRQQ